MCARKLSLAALTIVAFASPACSLFERPTPPQAPVIGLQIAGDGKVIANGRQQFDLYEFDAPLARMLDGYEARGVDRGDCTVEISGDATATFGQLERLIEICQLRMITRFSLKFDRNYDFTLPLSAPREGTPDDIELPPFRLRLAAGEDGSLHTLRLDNQTLGANMTTPQQSRDAFAALHNEIVTRLGDERGPDSLADQVEVEIRADPRLKLAHLGEAYAALSGYRTAKGEFVPLVRHIYPVGLPGEEVVEIVEFEELELEPLDVETELETEVAPPSVDIAEFGIAPEAKLPDDNDDEQDRPIADMSSRDPAQRKKLVKKYGGSDASEKAVAAGLKWIASRQASDGGWNFDHNDKLIAAARCPDPGTADLARNGATGMALLPFLAAGQTHAEGAYKKQVHAGLAYLIKNMKVTDKTGSWHEPEGTMYAHGFAAIAMCEAYAMTHDKELLGPAQMAINYIAQSQDPVGGGWRYAPKQAGDTSVSALQTLALNKGHNASLEVPKGAVVGSIKFLDSVQSKEGANYGYTTPAEGRGSTTAMGLLSRIYLGWKEDNDALKSGVDFLDKLGPSKTDIYYNYYATAVMFQFGGEPWQRWNDRTRDMLVASQVTDMGGAAGSWHFKGGAGNEGGGRLLCTSLATLILETYYREPRVYEKGDLDDEFPL